MSYQMHDILRKQDRQNKFVLTIIYAAAHWFLLVASGRWWDDWVHFGQTNDSLKEQAFELGRPDIYLLIRFAKSLPECGYRIIVFFLFLLGVLFLYGICRRWLELTPSHSLCISVIYAVVPVDDARMTLSTFSYSVGFFFFMLGSYYMSCKLKDDRMTLSERLLGWTIFLLSFTYNAAICLYSIVIIMVLTEKKELRKIARYIDYFLLPIAFYLVKTVLFPVHGAYDDYNTVNGGKIIFAIRNILPADLKLLRNVFANWFGIRMVLPAALMLSAVITAVAFFCKKRTDNSSVKDDAVAVEEEDRKRLLEMLAVGIIVLSAGLFPFVLVRQSDVINTTGVGGRDALAASIGIAIVIGSLIATFLSRNLQRFAMTVLVICGICFFNVQYISYQQDYYGQLGFQHQLSEHTELSDFTNMVYINNGKRGIATERFYSLNANAEIVYKDQNRLIIARPREMSLLKDKDGLERAIDSDRYHMSGYVTGHDMIDAAMLFSQDLRLREVLLVKSYELTGNSRFEKMINNRSSMKIYMNDADDFRKVLADNGYKDISE